MVSVNLIIELVGVLFFSNAFCIVINPISFENGSQDCYNSHYLLHPASSVIPLLYQQPLEPLPPPDTTPSPQVRGHRIHYAVEAVT